MPDRSESSLERRLETYFDRLWPLCRSITGPGFRRSLDILSEIMPMRRIRFKTGRKVLDWRVPKEWTPRDAYLVDPRGRKRAEFKKNNLHLVGYSAPFRGTLSLEELRPRLHSLPDQPDAIPYMTSYYKENWGFCLTHRERRSLPKGRYRVVVDTTLKDGFLEVGEALLPGKSREEILFSSYLCHPSMANNELSGPLAMSFLYERLAERADRRYTYRFVLLPETIGSICYLDEMGAHLRKRVAAGYVLTCVGDAGGLTYKRSYYGDGLADRAAAAALRERGNHTLLEFDPSEGSDERQYSSPGFRLPVGSLMRTPYYKFPEYHTSLDNKEFIRFPKLRESVEACLDIVDVLEANVLWENTVRFGEPQLGRRGLYALQGAWKDFSRRNTAMLWLLNLADGTRDLIAVAERSRQPMSVLIPLARELARAGLLKAAPASRGRAARGF